MVNILASLALLVFSAPSVADQILCGQYDSTQIGNLKFSTNAWGDDGSGGTCIERVSNISSLLTATWNYSSSPTRVHSYPNIGVLDPVLPLRLASLNSLNVSLLWSMGAAIVSSSQSPKTSPNNFVAGIDVSSLNGLNAISNVAIDMFLDVDQGKAVSTTQAQYEVMIWFGTVGGIQPFQESSLVNGVRSCEVPGIKFTLSTARNQANQTVHTWLASSNMTSIGRTDFVPLLQYLHTNRLLPQDVFIGTLQFGSETFHADGNVTFQVKDWSFEIGKASTSNKSEADMGRGWRLWWLITGIGLLVWNV